MTTCLLKVRRQATPFENTEKSLISTFDQWIGKAIVNHAKCELQRAPGGYRFVFAHRGRSGDLGPETIGGIRRSAAEAMASAHIELLARYPGWVPIAFGHFTFLEQWETAPQ